MRSYIHGVRSVLALLDARGGAVEELLVVAGGKGGREEAVSRARELGISSREVSSRQLSELCGSDGHQGLAARASLPEYSDLGEVMARPPYVLLALDGITDPMNLGAMVRSAEALGASGALVGKDRSAGITSVSHKASAGAMEYLPVCREVNISRALRKLKEAGYWVYGAESEGGESLESVEFSDKTVLVVGSEGKGARPGVKKEFDFRVSINLSGRTKSLNASVACAILVHDILKKACADS